MPRSPSIDADEIARFATHKQDWWNPEGVWSPLHKLNPARTAYVHRVLCRHFSCPDDDDTPFKGLTVLDLGCGGGLLCEPLAQWGAKVTGLDASAKAIDAARNHAEQEKLKIAYINSSAEAFAHGGQTFDAVLAMEILEHVADVDSFLASARSLLKPDGILILSTINRTTKSFLLGVVAAEFILGWVPVGMHDWKKFIRPSELNAHLDKADLVLDDLMGMTYNPINSTFALHPHRLGVNYLATAVPKKRR